MVEREILKKTIASNVTRIREDRGWSQDQLAKAIGVSRVQINRVEMARALPGSDLLYSLADVLGVSTDTLRQVSGAEKISTPS